MTNRCIKWVVNFSKVFQILSWHVSASGCQLQVVVGALEATQVMSVLWAYTGYEPSSVARFGGMVNMPRNGAHGAVEKPD
jgi:hypothetical protein